MRVPYVDFKAQYAAHAPQLIGAARRILSGGEYILGREVEVFEERFARLCGVRHAVGVSNGTDALVLVLKAGGVGPGDEVLTVPNSFVATASSIELAGARPVFIDVGDDQLMDPERLARAVTRRTRAIVPVHLTGRCCDMRAILTVARKHRLLVVEDAAQAVGAKFRGRPAGSLGRAACFSFHPLKNLNAAGDAGAVVTDSGPLARRLRLLRNHGMQSRNKIVAVGYNARLDALQAGFLNARLRILSEVIGRRRRNAQQYREGLRGVVGLPPETADRWDTYHLFVIQCDRRDALKSFLKTRGISSAVHYPKPLHLQPAFRHLGYHRGSFPRVERQAARVLSLPVHQCLSRRQIAHVVSAVREFYGA
ncbi:MAG: DegT/DnrJ/EryC1/StrS family aminotransferase [Elusimicrobiota bacterium]